VLAALDTRVLSKFSSTNRFAERWSKTRASAKYIPHSSRPSISVVRAVESKERGYSGQPSKRPIGLEPRRTRCAKESRIDDLVEYAQRCVDLMNLLGTAERGLRCPKQVLRSVALQVCRSVNDSHSGCQSEQPRQQWRSIFLLGHLRWGFLEVLFNAVLPGKLSQSFCK
jgi:hypothetical protein